MSSKPLATPCLYADALPLAVLSSEITWSAAAKQVQCYTLRISSVQSAELAKRVLSIEQAKRAQHVNAAQHMSCAFNAFQQEAATFSSLELQALVKARNTEDTGLGLHQPSGQRPAPELLSLHSLDSLQTGDSTQVGRRGGKGHASFPVGVALKCGSAGHACVTSQIPRLRLCHLLCELGAVKCQHAPTAQVLPCCFTAERLAGFHERGCASRVHSLPEALFRQ